MWNTHKMKECKKTLSTNKNLLSRSYFGSLVLAAFQCYCREKGDEIRTSFKIFVSKNTTTWW